MLFNIFALLIVVLGIIIGTAFILYVWDKGKRNHPFSEQKGLWNKIKNFWIHY